MGRPLVNNDLNLQTQKERRVGLRRYEDLPFASLHGGKDTEKTNLLKSGFHMPMDVAIDAPPLSSSNSETGSDNELGDLPSGTSDHELASSRRRGSHGSDVSKKKRRRLISERDRDESDDNCMKSNLKSTVFSYNPQQNTGASKSSSIDLNDSGNPFGMSSSQPGRVYGSKTRPKTLYNIHAQSSPKSRRRTQKSTSAPSSQSNGLRSSSETKSQALDRRKKDEKAKASSIFKVPPAIQLISPQGNRPRRLTRNRHDPTSPPTPEKPFKPESNFKVPAPNPLAPKFRTPGEAQNLAKVLPSEAAKIIKDGFNSLGVNTTTKTIDVPSSLPSVPSIIPDNISETSSISTPPSSADLEADRQLLDLPNSPTIYSETDVDKSSDSIPGVCPVCKVLVPKDLITSFHEQHALVTSDGRIPWSLQKLFCRTHIANAARKSWRERGYPDIDWENFTRRIEQHETMIEAILVGKKQSHHRRILEEKVKSGRKMTFVRSLASSEEDGGCQTGYYGSKGARIMMEHLAKTFSNLLGELNDSDKLISAGGGVSAYVQAVLVPELATALIKEDMGVNEERARKIVSESADLGELVNEEEGDVVNVEEVERKRRRDEEERREERAMRKEQQRREDENVKA